VCCHLDDLMIKCAHAPKLVHVRTLEMHQASALLFLLYVCRRTYACMHVASCEHMHACGVSICRLLLDAVRCADTRKHILIRVDEYVFSMLHKYVQTYLCTNMHTYIHEHMHMPPTGRGRASGCLMERLHPAVHA